MRILGVSKLPYSGVVDDGNWNSFQAIREMCDHLH